jgi:hypothetical protein
VGEGIASRVPDPAAPCQPERDDRGKSHPPESRMCHLAQVPGPWGRWPALEEFAFRPPASTCLPIVWTVNGLVLARSALLEPLEVPLRSAVRNGSCASQWHSLSAPFSGRVAWRPVSRSARGPLRAASPPSNDPTARHRNDSGNARPPFRGNKHRPWSAARPGATRSRPGRRALLRGVSGRTMPD